MRNEPNMKAIDRACGNIPDDFEIEPIHECPQWVLGGYAFLDNFKNPRMNSIITITPHPPTPVQSLPFPASHSNGPRKFVWTSTFPGPHTPKSGYNRP
jgi:hypothetical protein